MRETTKDKFGLYKRYQTEEEEPHDPDARTSLADLQDDPGEDLLDSLAEEEAEEPPVPPSISPYPNQSCFQLGGWFWDSGAEKSLKSFRTLVDIVGSESFKPADIREANWEAINRELGSSQFERDDPKDSRWYDDGTSWTKTSVTIDVPFNHRTSTPGPQPYTLKEFRYRPLLPLIREKLQNSYELFHFIPHELRWQPGAKKEDVRVHCELYQSDAFLEAYEEVQVRSHKLPPCRPQPSLTYAELRVFHVKAPTTTCRVTSLA
jgi:hypothetical protein